MRKEIDSICKAIDKDALLKTKKYDQEAFMDQTTDEGGELIVYHRNDTVHRIKEQVGLSYAIIIRNYYFKDKLLLFVKEEEYLYETDKEGGIKKEKLSKKPGFVGKYYFQKGKLTDQESLGHNRFEDDNIDAEKEYLTLAKKYMTLFFRRK